MTLARQTFPSPRALTLVEVLLAVLLLAITIGVVMNAVSSITGMEGRGRERVAAYEVANRIMLQYLDDPKQLPSKALPIEYGDHRFFWDMSETPAKMIINPRQESSGVNLQALDRYGLVCVEVSRAERTGDLDTRGESVAFLSRAVDPAAPRNPDSLIVYANDPDAIIGLINRITGNRAENSGTSVRSGSQLK